MEEFITHKEFEKETYSCRNCNCSLDRDEIENWKCPRCGNRVIIKISNKHNDNYILVRVLPSELRKSDSVFLDDSNFYTVLGVNDQFSGERIYANLEEYGSFHFKDTWINVMWRNNEGVY
ncbi:hypothetical protein CAT7_04849 [Carnobacterium sp. AT7]|uniref:hypothetical protein n=1 Tax=Carnobacterium sp. AT7 TaxID=333990 RepID=UPI00015F19E5|nr:hypothetical protein [Carnobacterium sp. AT7]EDP68566.1 hypothetical protein CAT7_04849 [Carnobacterium sp. AT7]